MTPAVFTNSSKLRHQANIAASLAHRIQKAKAAQNADLLALLEREQRQLSIASPIKAAWQRSINALPDRVSIEPLISETGAIAWRATDPRSGETRYAETEAELIDWIEDYRTPIRFLYRRQGFFSVLSQQFH